MALIRWTWGSAGKKQGEKMKKLVEVEGVGEGVGEGYHLLKEYRRMKNGKLKLVKVTKVKDAERVSFDQLLGNAMKFRVMEEKSEKARNEAMFEAWADAACGR